MTIERGEGTPNQQPLSDQDIAAMVEARMLLEGAEGEALHDRGVASALADYIVAASVVPGFRGAILASVTEIETQAVGVRVHTLLDGDYDELGRNIFTLAPNDAVNQWSRLTRISLELGVRGIRLPVRNIGTHTVMNSGEINISGVLADPRGYIDRYNQGQGFGSGSHPGEGPNIFLGVLTPQRPVAIGS